MNLAPLAKQRFNDNNNRPLDGGKLFTYVSGTTTKQTTYSDSAGTSNSNPVILDFRGECNLWLDTTKTYKFTLAPSNDTDPPTNAFWSVDNIPGGYTGTINASQIHYDETAAEIDASVTPVDYSKEPGLRERLNSDADYSAVLAVINTQARYNTAAYRSDHSQHASLSNCIVGYRTYDDAGKTGTVGYRNTAIGANCMTGNTATVTAGGSNTAVGFGAMENCTDGSGNSVFGAGSLQNLTSIGSSHNNCFGYRTAQSLVIGTQNNIFGFYALGNAVKATNNHAFGESAQFNLINGDGNHSVGYQANYSKIGGNFTHGYGYQALFGETSGLITAITKAASAVATIGTVSPINPVSAGQYVVFNAVGGMTQIEGLIGLVTAIGGSSGAWTITTDINSAGFSTYTSGGYLSPVGNTAIGYRAGFQVAQRGCNTIVGYDCAGSQAETGMGTVAIGFQAGWSINCNAGGGGGALNTVIGFWAARAMTTGANNVAIGQRSAIVATTGSDNVSVGQNSANGLTTASNNVAVGAITGINLNGNNNTSVGYNAGSQGSAQTYTNCGSFGANAVPTAANQITLGDSSIATLRCQQTSITALSDARFKNNIKPLDIPDDFLDEVEIVTYQWIASEMPQGQQIGVIAQQLDALQEKYGLQWLALVDKTVPERWEATPGKLLFLLIRKMQKMESRLSALERVK